MDKSNKGVAGHFNRLSSYYRIAGEAQKATTFGRVATAISELDSEVATYDFKVNKIYGVGGSSIKEIQQYLETGTSDRLKDLEARVSSRPPDLESMRQVPGLSIVQALSLWKSTGAVNLNELAKHAQNGSIPDKELADRIMSTAGITVYTNRSDIEPVANYILQKLSELCVPGHCDFAGSMRRKKDKIKDLDFVVALLPQYTPADIYEMLKKNDWEVQYGGNQKIRVKVPYNTEDFIECDIVVTSKESYACAITYSTGSKEFNIAMRGRAKSIGWSLNQHCLSAKSEDGQIHERYPQTEQELFQILGMQWVAPEDRVNGAQVKLV